VETILHVVMVAMEVEELRTGAAAEDMEVLTVKEEAVEVYVRGEHCWVFLCFVEREKEKREPFVFLYG